MKKMILLIALLFSVAGAQLMADGCNACAMKHGASKEERQAKKEQKKKKFGAKIFLSSAIDFKAS